MSGGAELYLVDGTYELFRCFHGAPRARTTAGVEVGAVRGLLATFAALVNEPGASHIAVAFDAVVPPAGLARMKPGEAELASQVGRAADATRALGLPVWPSGRFQADELLATAAARFEGDERIDRIVICTTDLDLAQCVRGDRIVLLDRSRKRVTTEADVLTRFGVSRSLLADLFALVGDRSDGIAGVPGWGVRSASPLLQAYGSVDAIPDDHTQWTVAVRGGERLAAALRARREEAIIARDVLTLRADIGLHVELEDLEWRGAHRALADELVAVIEYGEPFDWVARWADDRLGQAEPASDA